MRLTATAAALTAGFVSFASIMFMTGSPMPAQAAGVCNCCVGSIEDICTAACESANIEDGICRPAAFFGDASGIGGQTPLNGFSYRNLKLDKASPFELETLRQWLERERQRAERRFRQAKRDARRKKISQDEYNSALAIREEAIVNYQHGMQKYIAAQ